MDEYTQILVYDKVKKITKSRELQQVTMLEIISNYKTITDKEIMRVCNKCKSRIKRERLRQKGLSARRNPLGLLSSEIIEDAFIEEREGYDEN